jgi:hypothetical protein
MRSETATVLCDAGWEDNATMGQIEFFAMAREPSNHDKGPCKGPCTRLCKKMIIGVLPSNSIVVHFNSNSCYYCSKSNGPSAIASIHCQGSGASVLENTVTANVRRSSVLAARGSKCQVSLVNKFRREYYSKDERWKGKKWRERKQLRNVVKMARGRGAQLSKKEVSVMHRIR